MKTEIPQASSATQITQLTEAGLPLALDFRHRMMAESGMAALLADDWRELTHRIYAEGYRAGTIAHFGWRENGRIVATAGVMIRDDFPANTLKPRRYGWIMDVYVLLEHRRHGHACRLTEHTLAWLRAKGVVFARLVASEQAKQARLYEKLGFTFANEMRINLATPAG
jgi:GNAT superfamily N-acetyltransferase